MKKLKKFFLILLLAILIIFTLNNGVEAQIINTNSYNPVEPSTNESQKVVGIAGKVLYYVELFGISTSVIVLAIIGIKYMVSSASEKADYKSNMTPYIVGCILLGACTTIPSLIYNMLN